MGLGGPSTAFNFSWLKAKYSGKRLNSTESVPTQQVEVNVFTKFDLLENSFRVTPFVKDDLSVGSKTIDVPFLQVRFPHLQPIKPIVYNYSDVEMMLEQDVFHAIKLLENIKGGNQKTAVAVRMPIGWVLSGSLSSPNGVLSTTFKFKDEDVALAEQVKKWYELESNGTFKPSDHRYAADKRDLKSLDSTRLHDGSRYNVGMLWDVDKIHLPDNFYALLVQFKSLERRLEKDLNLKTQYASDYRGDVKKGYLVLVSPHYSKKHSDRECYVPHNPVLNPNKPGKFRRV